MKALNKQVSGNHYKHYKIQPVEFCQINKIPYCEANVIKYMCRWRDKNGRQDLEKAKHYIDLILEIDEDAKRTIQRATKNGNNKR